MRIVQMLRHITGVGLLLLIATGAWGLEAYMLQDLPVYAPYDCTSCHFAAQPTSDDLNAFGRDYRDFGPWGERLAAMDSDEDGCTNGAELGDIDGNGRADDGVTSVSSNPGEEGDCTSANPEEISWGQLKAIFDGSR